MSLAVLVIVITGFLAYQNFNEVISTVRAEGRPDLKLLSLKDIVSNISEGNNSVRSYIVTGEEKYLTPYYNVLVAIDDDVSKLYIMAEGDTADTRQLDSLNYWIDRKADLWKKTLAIRQDDRVATVLKNISEQINQGKKTQEKDLIKKMFKTTDKVNATDLQQGIEKTGQNELKLLKAQKANELQLIEEDNQITERILEIVATLEATELDAIQQKTARADKLADKANLQIVGFCVAATLILLFAIYMLFNFLQKATEYEHALEDAKEKAENIGRMKEQFLATMSHEMRTPLNSIVGLTDELVSSDKSLAKNEELLIIQRSTNHLVKIANDILDFSKLEAGKLSLEKINFSPSIVFEDVKQMLLPAAKTKGVDFLQELDDELPKALIGDPIRLKQILINLVSNAIKFTGKGNISIKAEVISKGNSQINLEISVSDTGIGIAKHKLESIFEDFSQAEAETSRKYGGTGLGLSIVKKLVELHNGDIEVTSEEDIGTTFICNIPYEIGDPSLLVEEKETQTDYKLPVDINILAADDEEYNLLVLRKLLAKWKARYVTAINGAEALEKFEKDHFDLVLIDLNMPKMDGMEFTRKIRNELSSNVPVIALTGAISTKDVAQCKKAGINSVLPKPYKEKILYQEICNVLGIDKKISTDNRISNPKNSKATDQKLINLTHLKRLSNGDDKFVAEMLETFITTTENGIVQIKEAIGENEWDKVAEHIHRIAAPCRHLEAEHLLKLLKTIEAKARDEKERKEVPELFSKAENSLVDVVEEIRQELKSLAE